MTLEDFANVAQYNDFWVGVEVCGMTIEEFKSTDKRSIKSYADYIVTCVWIYNEDMMSVTVSKGE